MRFERRGSTWRSSGWWALVSLVGLLVGCGDIPTHKSVAVLLPDVLDSVDVTESVGPGGGSVQAGSVELDVPAGAVAQDTEFTVRLTDDHPRGSIGPVYAISATGAPLTAPIKLTFHLAPKVVPDPYQYQELKLAYVDQSNRWQVLQSSYADLQDATVSGKSKQLSAWGILPRVKVDILWVIDDSPSMCQEHGALAAVFDDFVEKLQWDLASLDIQVAVTTASSGSPGRFVTSPATSYPPACYESRVVPCDTDAECALALGDDHWECQPAQGGEPTNLNGSVNSLCTFRCAGNADCCLEFCAPILCDDDPACRAEQCSDTPDESCPFACETAGRATDSGCLSPPPTASCPATLDPVLQQDEIYLFPCLAQMPMNQAVSSTLEQGLGSAWLALQPDGPNGESGFLRDDAYLLIIFVSDEDDCTVAEDFAAPNHLCESTDDCPTGAECRVDAVLSAVAGEERRTCHGTIKKDYYGACSLLGEWQGTDHHQCAYDQGCAECVQDEDCLDGWLCGENQKCRPEGFAFGDLASYQSPPGTPRFSLSPVVDYATRFKSLKQDPGRVLVAAITGDGIPAAEPAAALISATCLDDLELADCVAYREARDKASAECLADPAGPDCGDLAAAGVACSRACYRASKGDPAAPGTAERSYVCANDLGTADYGSRYIRLAGMFGAQGTVTNICSPDAMGVAVEDIASMVIGAILEGEESDAPLIDHQSR